MSVNIQTENGLLKIAGGGNTSQVEAKLAQLEFLIEQTKNLRADLESYGMVKLSDASNVTDSTGLALPATEKNPNIAGTLAMEIIKRTSAMTYQNIENIRGLEDEGSVEVSVDVTEDGVYAILAYVSACGASGLTKESPFFECELSNNQSVVYLFNRPSFNINVSKIWDVGNAVTIFKFLQEGVLNAKFTSHAGNKLDSNYPSGFGLQIVRI